MKTVAFIFAHKESDKWSTPLAIVNEFKSRGWNTPIYSLFDDNNSYTDENIYKLLETKPDIIIHMDWGQHKSPVLSKLRETGAFCVMESGDDPQQFSNNSVKAPWFDLILSPDIRAVKEYRNRGYNAEWWTHFADTRIYFPLEKDPEFVAVCSRGKGNMCPIIDELTSNYEGIIHNQNGWHGSEHAEFLNSGLIVLQQSKYKEVTRRLFEGMACKKLVIADRLPSDTEISSLFVEGEDIIFYSSLEECAQLIQKYSENHQERERISLNGYNKVINNHTQIQRVDLILEKWKNYLCQ